MTMPLPMETATKPISRDVLEAMLRQAQREVAKTDVFEYGEYVFGWTAYPHHRKMVGFAQELLDRDPKDPRGKKGVILAPRGSSKSTWLNSIWLSWLVATRPDLRIGLFSNTDKKVHAMSSAIRWTLSENEQFKSVFGDLRSNGGKWTDAEWLRKGSKWASSNHRTMIAAGVNPSAVSKRFDLIFCDDVLDAENTYTIDRRDKVEDWFWRTLGPCLVPGGTMIMVGTRWAEGDLYEKLIDSNKWPSLLISAIDYHEDGTESSYWPEWWPIERLHQERDDIGWDNFACAYLNDIGGLREGFIFKRDWFDYFDELPNDRTYIKTMGIDLATSERERADWTARAIVAEDDRHEHWVLGTYRVKTESGHRQFVADGYAAYPGISKILIETNQHQSTLVQDLLQETNMPVVGRRTDIDKRTRARSVAARYESHRVHHHRSLKGGELEMEMLGFPKGHDDLIDAVGLAMDLTTGTGSFASVSAPLRGSDGLTALPEGQEVRFVDGPHYIPAYMADMLRGIDTVRYSKEEALRMADRRAETKYVQNALRSFLG